MKANATNQMRITTSTKHNKLGQKKNQINGGNIIGSSKRKPH